MWRINIYIFLKQQKNCSCTDKNIFLYQCSSETQNILHMSEPFIPVLFWFIIFIPYYSAISSLFCIILIYHLYYLPTCWTITMEDKMQIQVHNAFLNIFLKPLLKSLENEMPLVKIIFSSNGSFEQFDGAQKNLHLSVLQEHLLIALIYFFFHQALFRRGERFPANINLLSKSWGILMWISYFCSKQRISLRVD